MIRIPKNWLFIVAGLVWNYAGAMLLIKGINGIFLESMSPQLIFFLSLIFGAIFYFFMFHKISNKHLDRILSIEHIRPSLFSFFSVRSYILMGIMISLSIVLKSFHFINQQYMFMFYIVMGIPLILSAMRFYRSWWIHRKTA